MKTYKMTLCVFLTVLSSLSIHAQEKSAEFFGSMQLWARYTSLNPGSTIDGISENSAWDFSMRRYRFGVKGKASENLSYYLQLGNNNLNRFSKDAPLKILDAYLEHKVNPHLTIVAGKHAFVGLSRWASPSTFGGIGTDPSFAATPFLNKQDDFFRRLGVAFKGQIQKIDYRVVIAKPFSVPATALSSQANFINEPNAIHASAYIKYQFLDKETQSSAFAPWTYHGSKQIFNIGTGFWYQTNSTGTVAPSGDTLSHDAKSFAVDVFYERTHVSGNTWTLSTAFIHHDLGPDYIRNIGVNNAANGTSAGVSFNGAGNAFPTTGTGGIILSHVGFLKPFTNEKGNTIGFQPYFVFQLGTFEVLDEAMTMYEGGINYLMNGHNSKITLGYQNRPIFVREGDHIVSDHHEGMIVLQYQVKFK